MNPQNNDSLSRITNKVWADNLLSNMSKLIQSTVMQWSTIVTSLGEDENLTTEWTSTFSDHLECACNEIIDDIQSYKSDIIVQIEGYLTELQKMCKSLHEEIPNVGAQELGLIRERNELRSLVKEYQARYQERFAEIEALKIKEEKLCKILGDNPLPITSDPLPSQSQVEKLQNYVESLETKRYIREERYLKLKEAIHKMCQELNKPIDSELEETILSNDPEMIVNVEKMTLIENFHQELENEYKQIAEEIELLWSDIESAWDILDIDLLEREHFRKKNFGNSINTLTILKEEHKRCDELKKANIKIIVEKYRKDLQDIWDKCHCSTDQRGSFKFYDIECYTETLLELLELEIKKWKFFYNDNKKLISLINEHDKLWRNMLDLEQKATDCNRYKNRGGQLLKEEKERNKLSKKIPIIENQLEQLSEQYFTDNGKPFLTFGRTVTEYIRELHDKRDNEKKLKLSAHKQKREQSVTPIKKCAMNLFPSASSQNIVTPSSTIKRKNCAATPISSVNKKLKMSARKDDLKSASSNTPGSVGNSRKRKPTIITTIRSKRLSKDSEKKIKKIRRISNKEKEKENLSLASDYADFEMRPLAYSSICEPILEG